MPKTIHLTFTDEQWAAMSDTAIDPKELLHNAGVNQASHAAHQRRSDPLWTQAVVSFAQSGGDFADDVAILAHGLSTGLFKDAATRRAEGEAAASLEQAEESQPG